MTFQVSEAMLQHVFPFLGPLKAACQTIATGRGWKPVRGRQESAISVLQAFYQVIGPTLLQASGGGGACLAWPLISMATPDP